MLLIKIVIGIFGLGIVVFIHELGHFLAARLAGIGVEAFCIGWGNPILKRKIGTVEYRLGMFLVGGYCKMKGETDYNEAWDNIRNGKKPEKGSYLEANPLKRILVCFAGPLFNLLFAVLLLSIIWGIGFEINTLGNKIILASEITPGEIYPADMAGLQTGDRIIKIDNRDVAYYHEVQENIALNPDKELAFMVERDGEIIKLNIVPTLDKSTGAGRIGVYFWTDPVIESVSEGSPAARAGLLPQDIILKANGNTIHNTMDLVKAMEENTDALVLEYLRNGSIGQVQFNREQLENGIGFSWVSVNYHTPKLSFFSALIKGIKESWKTLTVSIKSLRLLFKGIDLTQAVSGPVRITFMMGEAAAQGFGQGLGTGLRSFADFIALISIALCIMNLLPLPIIDGGMILLFLIEWIRRKPAHPKAVTVFQACGMIIIFGLMVFALFGDILYFIR
jgi:regulator of sigma E protease